MSKVQTATPPPDDDSEFSESGDGPKSCSAGPENEAPSQSKVLCDDNLLNLIFSFHRAIITSHDLLQASLTCKTFFHSAIRALWRSMDSMVPLVMLIPGIVKENGLLTPSTVIWDEDLERFDFYAQFVRCFEFCARSLDSLHTRKRKSTISPHTLFILSQHRPLGLLPSLTMLEITEFAHFEPGDMASLIAMIPSTGISGFNLKGIPLTNTDVEEVLAASILKSVHMKSPRLTSLAIEGCQTSTIFDVIQNIETLSSVSLDFRIIVLVSRPRTSAKLHRREYKLSNLVNLHLIGDTSSIAIMLQLGFPATPQLKNLRISLAPSIPRELEGRGDLLLLVDEITERAFFLDSLVIENDLDPGNPCLGLPLASLDYFSRPSCKKLKALTLSSLDDMSSVSFSRLFATPHRSLVSLDIRSGHRNASDNVDVLGFEVSLGGLQTICRMAPNLKRLHMPIYLDTGDHFSKFAPEESKGERTCHGLEELVLKPYAYDNQYPSFRRPSQKLANLLGIARHIDYLFPHLKKIDTQEIRPFVDENWLDGLEAAIKQFADIRKMAKGDCDVCRRDSEK